MCQYSPAASDEIQAAKRTLKHGLKPKCLFFGLNKYCTYLCSEVLKGERVVIIGLSLPNIYLEKFFNENVLIIVILEAYIYNKAVKKI